MLKLPFDLQSGIETHNKMEEKRKRVREHIMTTYFPAHTTHTQRVVGTEKMYGLLVSEINLYSCGQLLDFDRDMFVDPGEKMEKKE